LTATPTSKYH